MKNIIVDYSTQKLSFRIRKALRYLRLYGPGRTWIKIMGRLHSKKEYSVFPSLAADPPPGGHIGLIGCGNMSFTTIAYFIHKSFPGSIRAAMDPDLNRAALLYQKYGLRYYTCDAQKILNDPEINLFYIASNHSTHAEYAIEALDAGKNVHIEKPHVVSEDQLVRLCRAMLRSEGSVNLGFNRPGSRIGREIHKALAAQSGPSMMNWFVVGHELTPEHWYFNKEEGGRILGNLAHWTDFVHQMVDPEHRYPITIMPVRGKKADCDIAVSFLFGDNSIAVITFSAKGHTFEGVRERFSAQRGDVLISMDDFKNLSIEILDKKRRVSNRFRDQGHEDNVLRSYRMAGDYALKRSAAYVWETGELFLKTREALERNKTLTVQSFNPALLIGIMPTTKRTT